MINVKNILIKAESVIDCNPNKKSIKSSLKKIYSRNFQKSLKDVKNPYDNGMPSKKIVRVLKNINLENILKKNFYDIDFSL